MKEKEARKKKEKAGRTEERKKGTETK